MDSHAAAHGHGEDHHHPSVGTYVKIALVLFALTALEVIAYEFARRDGAPLHGFLSAWVVEVLLVLSALKFYLVAAFYMHLKQDSKLFSHLFVWPIIIAAVIILALIVLHEYWIRMTF